MRSALPMHTLSPHTDWAVPQSQTTPASFFHASSLHEHGRPRIERRFYS
jgi:hypothetical protein